MDKKLKKILALVISLAIFCFAIGCGGNEVKEQTPTDEYLRVASLDGENTIFNFDTVQKLKIEQVNKISSTALKAANNGSAIEETMLFELDRTDQAKVLSYGIQNYLSTISLSSQTNKLMRGKNESAFNGTHSISGGYYKNYNEYVQSMANTSDKYHAPDYAYKTAITLFDHQKLESIEGEKDSKTLIYTITGSAKSENYREFYDYYLSVFPFLHYRNFTLNPQNPRYDFFDPTKIESAKITIKSSPATLMELSIEIITSTNFAPIEQVTLSAVTTFQTSGFSVTTPEKLPPNW